MHVLFVHQNFPAQFRHISTYLAQQGWRCTFLSQFGNELIEGVERLTFKLRGGASRSNHVATRAFENQIGSAHGVYETLKSRPDIQPDLIVAHSGFGTSLFLPYLYDAPIINFMEYFYHPVGQDLGYRNELAVTELNLFRSRARNAMMLLDLNNCDRAWCATNYQRDLFPREYHGKIEVQFDGIPTARFHRKEVPGRLIEEAGPIDPDQRIVTYVARGFELMRGFDIFMQAAKRIYQQFPNVTFIVAGHDRSHYGGDEAYLGGRSLREHVLSQDSYDLSRFRFIERNSPELLSVGDAHVYLTVPFIASWSMVEAMACGAVVVASDQRCVREYITHGENGLLRDFYDVEGIADQVVEVLRNPAAFRHIGEAAAKTVQEKYSSEMNLPKIKEFFERVAAAGPRRPSHRKELLIKPGLWKRLRDDDEEDGSFALAPPTSTATASSQQLQPSNVVAQQIAVIAADAPMAETLRALAAQRATVEEWVRIAQSLRGTGPERIGPDQHPADLVRLLKRFAEWRPERVLVLSDYLGGMSFLLSRVIPDTATIIIAPDPSRPLPEDLLKCFQSMARGRQRIVAIPEVIGSDMLAQEIQKLASGKKFDIVFMNGMRPFETVRVDFKIYRNRIRRAGLFGWNGIQPLVQLGPESDGGDRLWKEVKPMYPQNAEYLAGCGEVTGGIAMIKVM